MMITKTTGFLSFLLCTIKLSLFTSNCHSHFIKISVLLPLHVNCTQKFREKIPLLENFLCSLLHLQIPKSECPITKHIIYEWLKSKFPISIGLSQRSCETFEMTQQLQSNVNAWKLRKKTLYVDWSQNWTMLWSQTSTHANTCMYINADLYVRVGSIELNWTLQTIDSFFRKLVGRASVRWFIYIVSIYRYRTIYGRRRFVAHVHDKFFFFILPRHQQRRQTIRKANILIVFVRSQMVCVTLWQK